jgi:hypothetical protein
MTCYRFRGIFLLLLMGHATACATTSWDNPLRSGFSASENDLEDNASVVEDYIELSQPDRILVRTRVGTDFRDRGQFYLDFPFVEGDNIVSVDSISVPIADVVNLESGYSLNSGQNAGALLLVGIGIVGLFAWLMGGDDDGSYCDDFFAYGKWGC